MSVKPTNADAPRLFAAWYRKVPTFLVGERRTAMPEIRDLDPCGFLNETAVDDFHRDISPADSLMNLP